MSQETTKTAPPAAGSARSIVERIRHMLAAIARWHVRWGGAGLALTASLIVAAWLLPWPWALAAALAAAGVLSASLAYVSIRSKADARDQAASMGRTIHACLARRLADLEAATERALAEHRADLAGLREDMRASWEQSRSQRETLAKDVTAVQADVLSLREALGDVRGALQEEARVLADANRAAMAHGLDELENKVAAAESRLREAQAGLAGDLATTREALEARTDALGAALASERDRWAQALKEEASTRALETAGQAQQLRATIQSERQARQKALQTEHEQRLHAEQLATLKPYQSHDRRLSAEDEKTFLDVWASELELPLTRPQLRYLQQRVYSLEDQCRGRLAGCVQDVILRLLLGMHAGRGKTLRFCEIGSLFGVNAVVLHDVLSCYCQRVQMTLIDPLDGYYAHGRTDPNTGLPVTREILESNLDRHGIPREHWRLIQAYSTDPGAVEAASDTRYDFLLIDGDHSYEGVCRDFELFAPMVTTDGLMAFDDYHRDAWPGVTRAVDDVVMPSGDFTLVGAHWQTAVFRRNRRSRPTPSSTGKPDAMS